MKKIFSTLVFAFVIILSNSSFAQSTWSWKQYNISFTLPSTYEVKTNTSSQFTASDGITDFGIFVFSDASVTEETIKDYTAELAVKIGLDEIKEAEELDFNGFHGGLVVGTKDGDEVIICGFMDPESDTNFFATIKLFGDVGEDEARDIFLSIKKKN